MGTILKFLKQNKKGGKVYNCSMNNKSTSCSTSSLAKYFGPPRSQQTRSWGEVQIRNPWLNRWLWCKAPKKITCHISYVLITNNNHDTFEGFGPEAVIVIAVGFVKNYTAAIILLIIAEGLAGFGIAGWCERKKLFFYNIV